MTPAQDDDALLVWALHPTVADGGVVRHELAWIPTLGLDFVLRIDGFAWVFAGLVTSIVFGRSMPGARSRFVRSVRYASAVIDSTRRAIGPGAAETGRASFVVIK